MGWETLIGYALEIIAYLLKNRKTITPAQLDLAVGALKIAPPPKED